MKPIFRSGYNVLFYGAKGWIGSQMVEEWKERHPKDTVIVSDTRIDPCNYQQIYKEIKQVERVVCLVGRTSGRMEDGTWVNTIDYLESNLHENLHDNLVGPMMLATICQQLEVHLLYIGTGCIFSWDTQQDQTSRIVEKDSPTFFGSAYSTVKGFTDQMMSWYSKIVCNCRIRMPIMNQHHGRNFITKIASYSKIHDMPNSMTYLPNVIPILIALSREAATGTFNVTNPGWTSHSRILQLYKSHIDPSHSYTCIEEESQLQLKSKRSNNILDTTKLETWCKEHHLDLWSIEKCLEHCFTSWNE